MLLLIHTKACRFLPVLWAIGCVLTAPIPAEAQDVDSADVALRQAVAEYDSDNPAVAEPLLRAVLRDNPSAFDPTLGSAAYWLGTLLWEDGRRHEAIRVWHRGWVALGRKGLVDLPLGDRLLWAVVREADDKRFDAATDVYFALLEHLEAARGERIEHIGARILVPLRLILPDSLRQATGLVEEVSAQQGRLSPGAGQLLAEWWRAADALPATERHERLIEHLTRIATAREVYPSRELRGFDDRGAVYIRFGPPGRTSETRLNPFDLGQSFTNTTRGIRTNLSTTVPSFRRNEFWVYPSVDRQAQFLFVEHARGEYRIGSVHELIPTYLRTPRYARLRLKILERVLRDLSLYHPLTYSAWYEEVAGYLTDLELGEISAQLDRLSGSPGLRVPLRFAPRGLSLYYMGHHVMEERRSIRNRNERIPAAFFDDYGDVEPVSMALRTARFLNSDGSTRVELYWTAPTSEFADANRRLNGADREDLHDFMVEMNVTEFSDTSSRLSQRRVRSRIEDVRLDDGGVVYPQTYVHERVTDSNRLAVQWDVFVLPGAEESPRHSKVATAVARLDSLATLVSDRRILEMSDLKPILVDPLGSLDGPVFPGGVLTPDLALGLEFEIYHLTFGADDRTRYTITYELEREEALSFRTRALQVPESRTITASTRYEGQTSKDEQTISLDLSEWDTPGRLRVLVRVRDEVSGQEVERSLAFDLEAGD